MSLSLWSTSLGETPGPDTEDDIPSVTALDFFSAVASSELRLYTSFELNLQQLSVRVAGRGGHATIEIGVVRLPHKHLVAVKRSRLPSKIEPGDNRQIGIGKDFDQLTRELRILGSPSLCKSPHIVDILGICIDDFNSSPNLALVLEYSSSGNLCTFLRQNTRELTAAYKLDFIQQASQGLDALHRLRVCHGDVKTENTLVFPRPGLTWLIKISDFGQAVISSYDDPHVRVPCPVGTQLLEAPELRRGLALQDPGFDIDAAMRTDTFSFGLFAWEVVKNGQRFFDLAWVDHDPQRADVNSMERFLNCMPENELIELALRFIQGFESPENIRSRLVAVLDGCLQETPTSRKSMSEVVAILDDEATSQVTESSSDNSFGDLLGFLSNDSIATWTTRNTLYEILDNAMFTGNTLVQDLPLELRLRILSELKILATNEAVPKVTRAHAAMTVSECYTVGFGGTFNMEETLCWLHVAASQGFEKAVLWYFRVAAAACLEPTVTTDAADQLTIERGLLSVPTESYLVERIQQSNRHIMQNAKCMLGTVDLATCLAPPVQQTIKLSIFNNSVVDQLHPLHVAAWFGRDDLVLSILQHTPGHIKSVLGFNAIHFACLGGHCSTLRCLLEQNVPLVAADFHSVTPLHFSIFFTSQDLDTAVDLLLDGQSQDTSTGEIKWDAHDITLSGTPLRWAITVRYRNLVRLLLPRYPDIEPLYVFTALEYFYWDILEDLLPRFHKDPDTLDGLTRLQTISRPFAHWIIHGSDHVRAIHETVQLCAEHKLIGFCDDGSSHLQHLICNATTEGDITLIDAILSISSTTYVRNRTPGLFGHSALNTAIQRAGRQTAWTGILERLVRLYTLEELQDPSSVSHGDYLTEAVTHDSVVGARVLLERGVDVNRPHVMMGRFMSTAIHTCIGTQKSIEMLSLLVEFGADLLGKDPITRQSPLQWLLSGRVQRDKVLEILLQREYPDEVYVETLHTTLLLQFHGLLSTPKTVRTDAEPRADTRDQFRHLLIHPRFARYIDAPDQNGTTMLQKAAFVLHGMSIRLLLEAGADASIPFQQGLSSVLPLQIACAQARALFITRESEADETQMRTQGARMAQAMEVAMELLKWHAARGDGLFQGITDLHLACRMCAPDHFERLARSKPNLEAKGYWPGVGGELTAKDLVTLDIQADGDAVLAFPALGLENEGPTDEATDLVLASLVDDNSSTSTASETLEY